MADLQTSIDTQTIRDQLYAAPDVFQIPLLFNQELSVETLSTRVSKRFIFDGSHDSFVVGHPVNGRIGNGYLGVGGFQIVVGDYRSNPTVMRVTNPDNLFREYLRDTLHIDLANSTASVDISAHKIVF
jgi:hypothetical protein